MFKGLSAYVHMLVLCLFHTNSSKQAAIVRASDDFYPRDPVSHTIHIAAVAYNSVFLGEFMQPDWDMFHSDHPAGEYHGSARAISGGPIYVRYLHCSTSFTFLVVKGIRNNLFVITNNGKVAYIQPYQKKKTTPRCEPRNDIGLRPVW